MTLTLNINGIDREIRSPGETPLLYVLRGELGLKGAKLGCGLEQCGACHVLSDGESVPTCVSPAATYAGKRITTIEGLAETSAGRRVQNAFVEATAAQCGYCTAGLVIAVTGLLESTPDPDPQSVRDALAPHLCRCGSHPRVLRAVELATQGA